MSHIGNPQHYRQSPWDIPAPVELSGVYGPPDGLNSDESFESNSVVQRIVHETFHHDYGWILGESPGGWEHHPLPGSWIS